MLFLAFFSNCADYFLRKVKKENDLLNLNTHNGHYISIDFNVKISCDELKVIVRGRHFLEEKEKNILDLLKWNVF